MKIFKEHTIQHKILAVKGQGCNKIGNSCLRVCLQKSLMNFPLEYWV